MGRSGKPTQAELRKQEKEDFLYDNERRIEGALKTYFLGNGYFPKGSNLIEDTLSDQTELAAKVQPSVEAFAHAMRLVSDGGSLTAKRKEQMLESVYAVERLSAKIDKPHAALNTYNEAVSSSSTTLTVVFVCVLFGLVGIFLPWARAICLLFFLGAVMSAFRTSRLRKAMLDRLAAAPAQKDASDVDDGRFEVSPATVAVSAKLNIEYQKDSGEKSIRAVDVDQFDPVNFWVIGFCHLRKDRRIFSIDRIQSAVDVESGEIVADVETFLLARRTNKKSSVLLL